MREAMVGLCLLVAGLPVLGAEKRQAVDLNVRGVLLLLGVGDKQRTSWEGTARVTAGEIRRVAPWRFRPDDVVDGCGWKTSSHVLQRPPRGNVRMSPTGVVLTVAAPGQATLVVETAQGKFQVALDALAPGRAVSALDGRVRIEEVASAWRVTEGPTENDFPACAVGPNGDVWAVLVQHTPRGPVGLQSYRQRPKDFKDLEPQGGGDQIAVLRFDGRRWSDPVAVTEPLVPLLPVPRIVKQGEEYALNWEQERSIGSVHPFYGNFGVIIKAYAYILQLGDAGLRAVSGDAVLNANYLQTRLKRTYSLPYDRLCKHEFVLSGEGIGEGTSTLDIAKRLLDYGFHPPTIYFPLIVHEALMIEPTETEGKETLDRFVEAMEKIAREAKENPDLLHDAPTRTPVRRLDQTRAVREPILTYQFSD